MDRYKCMLIYIYGILYSVSETIYSKTGNIQTFHETNFLFFLMSGRVEIVVSHLYPKVKTQIIFIPIRNWKIRVHVC